MKRLTLLVLTDGTKRPTSLSLSSPALAAVAAALVVFFVTFGFLLRSYYSKAVDQAGLNRLAAENLILRHRLETYDERLQELNVQMRRLVEFDTELRVIADLDLIDEDVRKLGVGGSFPTEDELRDLDPGVAEELEAFSSRLDRLTREVQLQALSFEQISGHMERSGDRRSHTPSIRPCAGWFVSGFGMRRDPFTGRMKFHDGLDIGASVGTPVHVTADGVVESIKYYSRGYGRTITINHGYGYKTVYAHLSLSKVKRYQRVQRGDVIGLVGNSGRSTGPHLHYEVQVLGKPTDPFKYIIPDEKYYD